MINRNKIHYISSSKWFFAICLLLYGCTSSNKAPKDLQFDSNFLQLAVEGVIDRANDELANPHSVLTNTHYKNELGAREYVSLATYWWPNEETASGLPYIRKDGHVNPETTTEQSNLPQLIKMARRIELLSAAYRFTGNDIYARRALEQLEIWFIRPESSMLPHLEHAQLIRGENIGRSYGVIDGWWLVRVVDSIPLLTSSSAWSSETDRGLKAWFTHYVNWLINSPHGMKEKSQHNNHGTWYDLQVITYADYLGWDSFIIQYLDTISRQRVSEQILFSGKQRYEKSRTRPEHYSIYNLYGLLRLARIARENGMDITEPDFLFSGSLHDAYSVLIDRVGQRNPVNFTEKFDETDTARIWHLLLIEAHLLFDEPATLKNLKGFVDHFPELHSRYMSASPEYLLALC